MSWYMDAGLKRTRIKAVRELGILCHSDFGAWCKANQEERLKRGIPSNPDAIPRREKTDLAREAWEVLRCMYVCRKVKNSQARTGHRRGMGGR